MPSRKPLNAALVQMHCATDREDNVARAIAGIRDAAAGGAGLVVLPELFASRYFCQDLGVDRLPYAEALDGPTVTRIAALAGELGVVVVIPIYERCDERTFYNTAVVADADGSIAGFYRKMHVPDDPRYWERHYFEPADGGFRCIPTRAGRLGVLICWDQWFPEAARLMALDGADVLIYPTAIGWDRPALAPVRGIELDAWVTVQRGHAIANCVPLIACNRWGVEPSTRQPDDGLEFWGNSFICGTQGQVLARTGADADAVLIAALDPDAPRRTLEIWPFFRDRRPAHYTELCRAKTPEP